MYTYLKEMQARLTEEDVSFLKEIYEPREMTTIDADAWHSLCVAPGGKIRFYGWHNPKVPHDHSVPACYMESGDCGLSWKKHMARPGSLGASVRIPYGKYEGKYMGIHTEEGKGVCMAIADSPDDEPFFYSEWIETDILFDVRLPLFLRSRERVVIIIHEHRLHVHPTCFFGIPYYSDDCGETWHRAQEVMAPLFERKWPHQGYRWQQNYREHHRRRSQQSACCHWLGMLP